MMVMFVSISVAGYLSLGSNMIPSLYTLRQKMHEGDLDIAMKIGEFGFLLVVLTCVPETFTRSENRLEAFSG
jgi:hypothetical protein